MNELEKSERLVEDALRLVSSVQVLQKAEKESIEGPAAGAAPAVPSLLHMET
jgi:hypothetical protein